MKQKTLRAFIACIFALMLFACASPCLASIDMSRYREAKTAINDGAALDEFNDLADHPLYPYLAASYYQNHLDQDDQIADLALHFYHARPIKNLFDNWVENKFEQQSYRVLTTHYFDTGNPKSNCLYRQAQMNLGNEASALENIDILWDTVESLPDECDRILNVWQGSADPSKRLQRAEKAYLSDNFTLARYLLTGLSGKRARTLLLLSELSLSPENFLAVTADALAKEAINHKYLSNALAEFARFDSVISTSYILQFSASLANEKSYQKLLNTLTQYLARRDSDLCLRVFSHIDYDLVEKATEEAIVRYLIASYRTAELSQYLTNPKYSMGQYWLAKQYEKKGNRSLAKKWWGKAAKTRSYYGFLAAEKIGVTYQMNIEPTKINLRQQSNFDKNKNLIRAKLLRVASDDTNARREILEIYNKLARSDRSQLAMWLHKNEFYFEAIYVFGKLKKWNDVDRRFPMPYDNEVQAGHQATNVARDWIYAIIRQESTMNRFAVSRARAKGLMQLIPSTASRMAKKAGVSSKNIFDPQANVLMGSQYLRDMYNKFGNSVLASAAYNAGPTRVKRWTEGGIEDIQAWIERIPFKETRKYVKNILEYRIVYQYLLDEKGTSIHQLLNEGMMIKRSAKVN